MDGGWFIGDFEPSVLRTSDFEVCYKEHKKGEDWPRHYHKEATEYNLLLRRQHLPCNRCLLALLPNPLVRDEIRRTAQA